MKKTKLALAVSALALILTPVHGATTIYGQINQIVSKVDGNNFRGAAATVDADAIRLHDNGDTILGIQGLEELGNGLNGIYQIEFAIGLNSSENDVTSSTSGSTNDHHSFDVNNTFVGIEGGFGAFKIGRMDTPAYAALDEVATLTVGGGHQADDTIGIGFLSSQTTNNMLNYTSPALNGFAFSLSTVAGEVADTGAVGAIAEGVSASLTYNEGAFYGAIAYSGFSQEVLGAADDTTIFGLGLKYAPGPWGIGYMYEKTESENHAGNGLTVSNLDKAGIVGADANEYESHLLIGSYEVGGNRVSIKYGFGEFNDAVSTERKVWGIGIEHSFSERTQVFAAYSAADDENNNVSYNSSIFSIGLSHSF